jgi:hypothetical protein
MVTCLGLNVSNYHSSKRAYYDCMSSQEARSLHNGGQPLLILYREKAYYLPSLALDLPHSSYLRGFQKHSQVRPRIRSL